VAFELDARALEALLPLVASFTGFHPDAIRPDALRRVARPLLREDGAGGLLARAAGRDPAVVAVLAEGVSVGETYFFRQPEHFRHLAEHVVAERLAAGARKLRVWSAGCATGEEAYSIAATLVGAAGGLADVEVTGTDLLERNVRAAGRGEYGPWSFREHCPLLHPVSDPPDRRPRSGETLAVSLPLRRRVAFSVANLVDAQPAFSGRFDAIFCRNVLVYFSAEAARAALSNLAEALAPGGVLYLGPMDATTPPPGLVELGPAGQNIYARRIPPPVARASTSRPARPRPPPVVSAALYEPPPAPGPSPASAPEPMALHLRALTLLEREDLAGAEALLTRLLSCAPDYLPGLLELALLHDRKGSRAAATRLMREILARTASMPREQRVPGPEELAIGYLQASARAYLGAAGGHT